MHKVLGFERTRSYLATANEIGLQLVECCFMSTETVGLLRTGAQDVHSDFHTAPEFCRVVVDGTVNF